MASVLDFYEPEEPFARGIPSRVFWDKKNVPNLPENWESMSVEEKDKYLKKGNMWEQFKDFLSDTSDKITGKNPFSDEFKKQADSLGMTPREYIRKVVEAYPEEIKKYAGIWGPRMSEGILNQYTPKDMDPNYTGPKPNYDEERFLQEWIPGADRLPLEDTVSSSIQARFLKGDNVDPDLKEKLINNAYDASKERNLERKGESIEPYERWKQKFNQYNNSRLDDFDSAYEEYRKSIKHMPARLEMMYRQRLDNERSE